MHCGDQYEYDCCRDIQNEPDEDHTEVASSSVSQGTVPKMPSKVFTSFPSKPENAQPFQSSDDLKNLVRKYFDSFSPIK
jgi:hypothetical protein